MLREGFDELCSFLLEGRIRSLENRGRYKGLILLVEKLDHSFHDVAGRLEDVSKTSIPPRRTRYHSSR